MAKKNCIQQSKRIVVNPGDKYNRLTIIREVERVRTQSGGVPKQLVRVFECRCECGNIKTVRFQNLRSNSVKSCGCLADDPAVVNARRKKPTHGHCRMYNGILIKSKTYGSWTAMKRRCLSEKHPAYNYYKDIKICDRWIYSFENFLEDMGERPEGMTLDRIDTTLGYFKENCRWATNIEQANNRRDNHLLTHNGQTYTIAELSRKIGMLHATITHRLRAGWTVQQIIDNPICK